MDELTKFKVEMAIEQIDALLSARPNHSDLDFLMVLKEKLERELQLLKKEVL